MIRNVPLTAIFVDDQEAALAFYTDKLELEKIQDEPYNEGTRWITVSLGWPVQMVISGILLVVGGFLYRRR